MKTLDIFAGCGGLSSGLHQAGVSETLWAVEYDLAASGAFKLNNPGTKVICANVSAFLYAVMSSQGNGHGCIITEEVKKESEDVNLKLMPKSKEVDFIAGGPPCQGYSGMNRFNTGQWSMVQNSMVI